jgi:hypothetical protein
MKAKPIGEKPIIFQGCLCVLLAGLALGNAASAASRVLPAAEVTTYADGRPTAKWRLEARDEGVVLRHGGGPEHCDALGARDVWVWHGNGSSKTPSGVKSHMDRDVGLAWLDLPLIPPVDGSRTLRKGDTVFHADFEGSNAFSGWSGTAALESGYGGSQSVRLQTKTNVSGAVLSRQVPVEAVPDKLSAAESTAAWEVDREIIVKWSAPYRGWHYHPEHVIPAEPRIPGHEQFHNTDCPCVFQLPGQPDKWFMSFIAFDGHGYNSFVADSTNLVQWTHPRLAMGFGPPGEFDFGDFGRRLDVVLSCYWTCRQTS